MTFRTLLAFGLAITLVPAVYAQDGLRSASLPERPIATPPPGPGDLFRATPGTYRPHDFNINRPGPDRPHQGRGSRPPDRGRTGAGWPYLLGGGYWPYYELPLQPAVQSEIAYGGYLQLRLEPGNALAYIDGAYAGTVDDLRQPGARLEAGTYRIRLEAPGYQARTFDVRIADGQSLVYRQRLDRETPAPTIATPAVSAERRTLYVIPLCYAGDKPPSRETGCDLTQLRTIR